jgi:HlyD family secretion protein
VRAGLRVGLTVKGGTVSEHNNNATASQAQGIVPKSRTEPGSLSDRVRSLQLPDRPKQAAGRGSWIPWLLCLALGTSTAAFAYLALYHREPVETKPPENAVSTATSPAPAAAAASGDVVLESKGNIVPVHQIQVSPKVSGMVEKLYIEEGKRVKKGDILAELEKVDYQAARDHAAAALEEARQNLLVLTEYRRKEIDQAKARWEEAAAQTKQLDSDYRRSGRLRPSGALADRDYEQAESSYQAMVEHEHALRVDYELLIKGPRDNQIIAAKKRVAQTEADLVTAQWRLDNCTVRAPITGTILTKKAEEGNIVNPIAFNISASLCDMADLSDLEVDLTIQERDIAKVFKDQRCKLRPEAFPERVYDGYVSRLMPIADRAKGAVPVRVKVSVPRDEEGVYLKPEMGVIVSFFKKK